MQVPLPLTLFCQLVAPQQTAQHKLTLDTNRAPPPLADLFEDLVAQSQASCAQSVQMWSALSDRCPSNVQLFAMCPQHVISTPVYCAVYHMMLAEANAWLSVDNGTPKNAHILVWNAALALIRV